jgi:DNA-binding MarR family transcriptional regulator
MKIYPEEQREDHVDRVRAEWATERPELDTEPIEVIARIGRLARLIDGRLDDVFAQHDLRRDPFDVLAALRRAGPPYELAPTDLYDRLMRTSGAVTNRLQRLEREGLVTRVPDPSDGRGLRVRLTRRGRELVDAVAEPHLANERDLLAALSPAEQRTLARLLKKLSLSLERS